MNKRVPGVVLFGLFGGPNFGNEASIDAFLFNLRKRIPNAHIACISPEESKVKEWYGLELIPLDPYPVSQFLWRIRWNLLRRIIWYVLQCATESSRSRRAKGMLAGFRIFAIPGTGIFDDFGQGPLDMPYHMLRWSAAARSNDASVCHVSVGAAEMKSAMSRFVFRRAAVLSTYRSFRDRVSKQHIQRLGGFASGDPVYPDLAFSLSSERIPPHGRVSWPPRKIGVGVMSYHGWNRSTRIGNAIYERYLVKMRVFVQWLLAQGYSVRLLTGDERADEKARKDLMTTLGASSDTDRRLTSAPIGSYGELLRQIGDSDLIVATRFHNVLFSFLLNRPVISIGYTDKNDALMKEMNLEPYCQHIESLDPQLLIEQFGAMARLPNPPISGIQERVAKFRSQLDEQYDRLFGTA